MAAADRPPARFNPNSPISFFSTAWAALSSPRAFFAGLSPEEGWKPPLIFLIITLAIPSLAVAVLPGPAGAAMALQGFIANFFQFLVFAGIISMVAQFLIRNKVGFSQALAIVAYAGGINTLSFLALLPFGYANVVAPVICLIVQMYLILTGLQSAGGMNWGMAAACLIISIVIAFMVMSAMSMLAAGAGGMI